MNQKDTWRREDTMNKQKSIGKYIIVLLVLLVGVIAIIAWNLFFRGDRDKEEKVEIITSSKLEDILKISELSTYKITFNGVASVKGEKDKLLYHVAYEAKVNVGLDMENINVQINNIDEKNRKVIVNLPKIEIVDVEVDPGSLDYIFIKDSANTDDVSITALSACKTDAKEECEANEVLFRLARENTVNTIKALASPLIEQSEGYSLEIAEMEDEYYE